MEESAGTTPSGWDRFMAANNHAVGVLSIRTFGRFMSREQKERIDRWVGCMPHHGQLEDAKTAQSASIAILQDWLNWSRPKALAFLQKLDMLERRFRITGIRYHKTEFALRHSETLLHGSRTDQFKLLRLSQIFETDRPRRQQLYFAQWYEIFDGVADILQEIARNEAAAQTTEELRLGLANIEIALYKLFKPLRNLDENLAWVENTVAGLVGRSYLQDSEMLALKHSREGGLFRRWAQTLPEVEHGSVEFKTKYIEDLVAQELEEDKVGECGCWSRLGSQ
ncbi:hypothetical protein TW65_86997 [Stemphylium lycopersici]|nr:hypothetical protein TW65_86997 [Stemphylium lycopersici]